MEVEQSPRAALVGDVVQRAGHAHGRPAALRAAVPFEHHIDVVPLTVPHPELELKAIGAACHAFVDERSAVGAIAGVHQGFDGIQRMAGIVVFIAEDLLPARREIDLVGQQVPVPEALVRALQREREALFALAQRLFGRTPAAAAGRYAVPHPQADARDVLNEGREHVVAVSTERAVSAARNTA